MPDHGPSALAATSLPRHLARGAIGFGLLGAALALTPSLGSAALLLAPTGLLAFRGCPACWAVGLIETISAGRLRRACAEDGCTLPARRDGAGTNRGQAIEGSVPFGTANG